MARRADAGDDVLALRVGQEVARRLRGARDLVAAEPNARAARLALVAEYHLLHVDRRAPAVGDAVDPPVGDGAIAGPGVEHRADRLAQLLVRILREVVQHREAVRQVRQLPQGVDVEFGVVGDPALGLDRPDRVLEPVAGDAARDVAEHLDEAPVGVPREALVAGAFREPFDRGVVEAEVEHGVEHPGHRLARARAHRHQQRVLDVAQALARVRLQPGERRGDLAGHPLGLGPAGVHVRDARLGGDREPGRDAVGAEHAGHLGDVRALAAEQLAHVLRAVGEVVHPPRVRHARIASRRGHGSRSRHDRPRAPGV